MSTPPHTPNKRWLTYGDVKRMIESCLGSDGKYTLNLWIGGDDPLLPRRHFQGRKWAAYDRHRVEELLEPMREAPAPAKATS